MRTTRVLGVVVAVLALVVAASSAQAAQKVKGKKHKKEHAVAGVVKELKKDADKDSGTITVKIGEHHHKKSKKGGGAVTAAGTKSAREKTFKVTPETKFVKLSGKKGAAEQQAAGTFAELKDGDLVFLEVKGDKAEEVKFHAGRHHKKGKKKTAA